jgi:hypothetical protein
MIKGYTYRHRLLRRIYAVEMRSHIMMYMSSFVKIGSDIKKLMRGHTQRDTDRMVIA